MVFERRQVISRTFPTISTKNSRSLRGRLQAILVLGCLQLSSQAIGVEINAPAPGFELPGLNGPVKLTEFRGKLVYLDFWASWCAPCKQSFPWMNEMQEKFAAQGLQIVSVNLDIKHEDARIFLAENKTNFVIAFDPAGATPKNYGIKGMPTSVLIDTQGRVISEHSGFNKNDKASLEKKIVQALKGNAH